MVHVAKAQKDDLKILSNEMGLTVVNTMQMIHIKDLFIKSHNYDNSFTETFVDAINETQQ